MTIIITNPEPDIRLTSEDYNRYLQEYSEAFRMYSGPRPSFEDWVRKKLNLTEDKKQLLNESVHR
jgi:hypothetical protein